MESILVLIFLSWIVSAIMSRNKKKKQQQLRQQQQQQQQEQQATNHETSPQPAASMLRYAQAKGLGYAAINPFAEAFQWAEEETVAEPVSDIGYTEGECYDGQHQHGVYVQETKWSSMDELTASSFDSLDSNFVEAPTAAVNKPGEPTVEAQPEMPNGQFAFIQGRSDVITGIIWSEILSRPQERMAKRYAKRFYCSPN